MKGGRVFQMHGIAIEICALTLLVGRQEGQEQEACKKFQWWYVGGDDLTGVFQVLQLQLSSPPSSSLAPVKSRMETFWCRLTKVVLENGRYMSGVVEDHVCNALLIMYCDFLGTVARFIRSFHGSRPCCSHVCITVVSHSIHCQVSALRCLSHTRSLPLWGNLWNHLIFLDYFYYYWWFFDYWFFLFYVKNFITV